MTLSTVVCKLVEKTPIAYSMARFLMMCQDHNLIIQDKEACSTKFKVGMKKSVEFKRLTMRNFTP